MKKKVLIFAGAGASLICGMPSISEIDFLFANWANTYHKLLNSRHENLYTYVRDQIKEYYEKYPKAGLRKSVNFEEVLYVLLELASMKGDELRRNPLNAFCDLHSFPDLSDIKIGHPSLTGFDFSNLAAVLVDNLLDEFRKRCRMVQTEKYQEFDAFRDFMNALDDDFDIGIITTNYDDLFKQAMPQLKTGFDEHTYRFMPEWVYTSKDWNFCYHVHGSVHFDQGGAQHDMHGIMWQPDLRARFCQNSVGRNAQTSEEGVSLLTSSIVAGYGKSNQIKRNPFRAYFAQIERLVLESDAFLFLGYGFGDSHVNLSLDRIRDERKRPVVVIDYAENDQSSMPFRGDAWSHRLMRTIPFDRSSMSYKNRHDAALIGELKANEEFEVSNDPDYPLAIWYGGFLNAGRNYGKIQMLLS